MKLEQKLEICIKFRIKLAILDGGKLTFWTILFLSHQWS